MEILRHCDSKLYYFMYVYDCICLLIDNIDIDVNIVMFR